MISLGTRVIAGGRTGRVVAAFADGIWARKFIECPWCDTVTWELHDDMADLSADSGTQYLVEDAAHSQWYLVDYRRIRPMQDRLGGDGFKVGGSD